ncbi:hypothetical protein HF995_13455 [Sanguibacter hominis ATCC BAA-789]|uniref:HNH domain-containing protein n=1 Tax=Sanguibacter hominis ATCC BAA-789 TaxID=1312740 RepID=A0A9X5ISQ2_9MICO|nr:hypothetical protein [Sanguibacter hominis]NKX94263.1 hypothetical protein [Sanguibacter hominis ATCC BAA-789]
MKSLRRKGSSTYRKYLRSPGWHARRATWFEANAENDGKVPCVVCRSRLSVHTLQLHHVDYRGVVELAGGRWASRERDDDLMPFCADCHEQLHTLFDGNPGWKALGRRAATTRAVGKMQRRLARYLAATLAREGL